MISVNISRLDSIGATRKQAATRWRDAFLPYNKLCAPAFSIDEEGPAPYRFVLKFINAETANTVFTALRLYGIAVESWPDLAPYVQDNKATHNDTRS